MLESDKNTKDVENKVLLAAKECFRNFEIEDNIIHSIYEHGHWWVRFFDLVGDVERTYSVCDAEGPETFFGFCFDEV